ncbi:MAG: hypothetical protein LBD20_00210 [Spirochaetaceae bacterium]|jgi:hypothetical protein|nr:hypothetical protein [Spirochaetaceae bacterium]
MITIQQTVDISANRQIHLDIKAPDTVPSSRTRVLLSLPAEGAAPSSKPELSRIELRSLQEFFARCKVLPIGRKVVDETIKFRRM